MKKYIRKMAGILTGVLMVSMISVLPARASLCCQYEDAGSYCEISWSVTADTHTAICYTSEHMEKNGGNPVVAWETESHTYGENGKCEYCGYDPNYKPENPEKPDTPDIPDTPETNDEFFLELAEKFADDPEYPTFEFTVSEGKVVVKLSDVFRDIILMEFGCEAPESALVEYEVALNLPSGNSYAYTGEEICPVVVNDEISTSIFKDIITVSTVKYENNVKKGTATASLTVGTAEDSSRAVIQKNFTIGDDSGSEVVPGENFTVKNLSSMDKLVTVSGLMEENSYLIVEEIGAENTGYNELVTKVDTDEEKVVAAYEVKVVGKIQDKVAVSFTVGTEYNGQTLKCLHGLGDGSVETFQVVVKNGKVTVDVNQFSPFVLTAKINAETGTGSDPGTTESGNKTEANTTGTENTVSKTENKSATPKTGDVNHTSGMVLMVLCLLSGMAVLGIMKKKVNFK